MKALRGMLAVLVLLAFIFTVIPLARAGPTKEKAFTHQAVLTETVAPTVANVPPMTVGYDVICNLTNAVIRAGNAQSISADTPEQVRQSTTVAERINQTLSTRGDTKQAPRIVLLA